MKCSKLSRGQIRTHNQTYICQLCLKDSLPVDLVSKPDKLTPIANASTINTYDQCDKEGKSVSAELENAGCGLCIECDNDCLTCDVCPDM